VSLGALRAACPPFAITKEAAQCGEVSLSDTVRLYLPEPGPRASCSPPETLDEGRDAAHPDAA
jgi:hypothetical protein